MESKKPKILVLIYSMYGHTYQMATAMVRGIEEAGGEALLKQTKELIPEENWDDNVKATKKMMKDVPMADPKNDLNDIDGVLVGAPTRFGNMSSQMRNYWDQTSGAWMEGKLVGKPAGVFSSAGNQHGGQEATIFSAYFTLLHHGALIVGTPYTFIEQMNQEEITGGSPYGAFTITWPDGSRMPSENEKSFAKKQGLHLTKIAKKLMN